MKILVNRFLQYNLGGHSFSSLSKLLFTNKELIWIKNRTRALVLFIVKDSIFNLKIERGPDYLLAPDNTFFPHTSLIYL